MGKKTANNAIDFDRLFSVKDQFAQQRTSDVNVPAAAANVEQLPKIEPSAPPVKVFISAMTEPVEIADTVLRIGMSRSLHERVRALAALRSQPSTALVRDLLERITPVFDTHAPMGTLADQARGAFPTSKCERRVDVRMQVPLSSGLHRRLVQLAALRSETLCACMSDVLEAHTPLL